MIPLDEDECEAGIPAWMATFADLMSLLMCFFVLLLSFSQIDLLKYKVVAGSMRDAFGVQNRIKVMDTPKGTSITSTEFSPGKPQPTPVETINQVTVEPTQASLSVGNPDSDNQTLRYDRDASQQTETAQTLKKKIKALLVETNKDADKLARLLKKEITDGKIEIQVRGRIITIRIREAGSFPSGSATLNTNFLPVMGKLRVALTGILGRIGVEGHTDDVPISFGGFRSNWDLSAARALSVAYELIKTDELDDSRFMVVGHADTKPHKPNKDDQSRAQNRRVEIIIRQGLDVQTEEQIKRIQNMNPDVMDILQELTTDL